MKTPLRDRAEAILKGEEATPALLRAPLALATCATRLGMALRGLKTVQRVPARVISYGNITLGGTGKTPAVIARAEAEIAAGRKVAVVTRGHGAPQRVQEPHAVGVGERADWESIGDEAALIAWRVPGCVIVRAADRVAGARAAVERLGCDTILLDDGFQSLQLHRDENIVLIDATCPFGNRRLVPAGYLREPLFALGRATEILLTRSDYAKDLDAIEAELAVLAPGVPLRRTRHVPTALVRLSDKAVLPLAMLDGMQVAALCGIGNPKSFMQTLARLGAKIREEIIVPDHGIAPSLNGTASGPLIMTEKDAVKFARPTEHDYALRIALEFCD